MEQKHEEAVTLPEVWEHPSLHTPGNISHIPTAETRRALQSLLTAPANEGNAQAGLRDPARTATRAAGQMWDSCPYGPPHPGPDDPTGKPEVVEHRTVTALQADFSCPATQQGWEDMDTQRRKYCLVFQE